MIAAKALDVPEVQLLLRLIKSRISSFNTILHDILSLCQRNVIFICVKAPRETVRFPFRCIGVALDFLAQMLPRKQECKPLNVAEILTGTPNPNYEEVCNASRQLCAVGMNTIVNQTPDPFAEVTEYMKGLDKWAEDNKKKMKEIFCFNDLKLATLKAEKMDKSTQKLAGVLGTEEKNFPIFRRFRKTRSPKKLISQSLELKQSSDELEDYLEKFNAQDKMDDLCSVRMKDLLIAIYEKLRGVHVDLNKFVENFEAFSKLNDENSLLREMVDTHKKSLNAVEEERDDLKIKLAILETLVDDQESFLNGKWKYENVSNNPDKLIVEKSREPFNCQSLLPKVNSLKTQTV